MAYRPGIESNEEVSAVAYGHILRALQSATGHSLLGIDHDDNPYTIPETNLPSAGKSLGLVPLCKAASLLLSSTASLTIRTSTRRVQLWVSPCKAFMGDQDDESREDMAKASPFRFNPKTSSVRIALGSITQVYRIRDDYGRSIGDLTLDEPSEVFKLKQPLYCAHLSVLRDRVVLPLKEARGQSKDKNIIHEQSNQFIQKHNHAGSEGNNAHEDNKEADGESEADNRGDYSDPNDNSNPSAAMDADYILSYALLLRKAEPDTDPDSNIYYGIGLAPIDYLWMKEGEITTIKLI